MSFTGRGGAMRRSYLVGAVGGVAALALPMLMAAPAQASAPAAIVEVRGGDVLNPGHFIKNNLRFVPPNITVRSGDLVKWVDADRVEEPHTVTIANKSDLPQSIAQLNACSNRNGFCTQTPLAHDPGNDGVPPFNLVVNKGKPGLNQRGDSLAFADGLSHSVTRRVTAPAGTTLYYMCVIHPWMQGSIDVI